MARHIADKFWGNNDGINYTTVLLDDDYCDHKDNASDGNVPTECFKEFFEKEVLLSQILFH